LPEEDTVSSTSQNRRKKKAVDATIRNEGQTKVVYIQYDDGSTEKFVQTDIDGS
jgi:hypothetical protein